MNRGFLIIAILLVLAGAAYYLRWYGFSMSNDDNKEKFNVQLTVDKEKVKDDFAGASVKAQELAQKTKEEAQEAGRKLENIGGKAKAKDKEDGTATAPGQSGTPGGGLNEEKRNHLVLSKKTIEVEQGKKTDLMLTSTGGDLKTMQVAFFPSDGSNLQASGGLFKPGQTETNMTVEAPKDARNGTITIVAGGQSEVLSVSVK